MKNSGSFARSVSWPRAAWGQQYTITTIAGNGTAGFAGDSGDATAAQLNSPTGLALDSKGNLYIADSANHRIRMISGGTITTVAGNGTAGFAGDKAAATSANLYTPTGVAVDSSGNLYIADSVNNVIRKVTGGTITTIAGDPGPGPGLRRRWRPCQRGQPEQPHRRHRRCRGQLLHRRQRQQPHPQGRYHRHHHFLPRRRSHRRPAETSQRLRLRPRQRALHFRLQQQPHRQIHRSHAEQCRRQPDRGLRRRWQPRDAGPIEQTRRHRDRFRRQHLYRRFQQQPHPQSRARWHHLHHRRQRRRGL